MIKRFGLAGVFAGMVVLACLGIAGCSEDDDQAHIHSYGEWETVNEPTCSEEGLRQHKCDCGNIESEAIQATGNHDYQVVGHKDADCTEDGYDLKKCSVCGDEKKDNIVSAKGHDYGDWVVDQVADKDHIGKKHRDCNSCGNS